MKIEKKKVPARPAQKNVPNPFKPGEFRDIAAKPAIEQGQGPRPEDPEGLGQVVRPFLLCVCMAV